MIKKKLKKKTKKKINNHKKLEKIIKNQMKKKA